MLTRLTLTLATITSSVVTLGCASWTYQGDGRLRDSGPLAARHRYVLDLGSIDLGRTGKYTYTMTNLPAADFAVGLEIVEVEANLTMNRPTHSGSVRLLLETSNREIVISEGGPLKSWVWSFTRDSSSHFSIARGKNTGLQTKTAQRAQWLTGSE